MLHEQGQPPAHSSCPKAARLADCSVSSSHAVCRTLHTTNHSYCYLYAFLHGRWTPATRSLPPKNNLQCSQTNVKVMVFRPSVSPSTCLRKSVKRYVYVSRLHIFQHLVPHCPITFLVHCGMSLNSNPPSAHFPQGFHGILLRVDDPLVQYCRHAVLVREQFLYRPGRNDYNSSSWVIKLIASP